MKVVCKDGTTIQCQQFRAIDSGVLLFEESPGDDSDDEEEEGVEATGFVPIGELKYVLPDRVTPGPQGQQAGRAESAPGQRPAQGGQLPGPAGAQGAPRQQGPPQGRGGQR